MKTFLSLFVMAVLTIAAFAQSPEAINYQAVARDSTGNVLINQGVSLRLSILQGGISGTVVYQEVHLKTTNQFGLVSLGIGTGNVISGDFAAIDWSLGPFWLTTEMDPAAGIDFQMMGSSQFLSVPYSLYAKTAGSVNGPNNIITDGNNDTKVQTEKNPNEDIIRFDLGGAEKMTLIGNRLELKNLGYNMIIGEDAGVMMTSGTKNTALGYSALHSNQIGYDNVANGYQALSSNYSGSENVAIGSGALHSNNSGFDNVANGCYALYSNTTGDHNVAIGTGALYTNSIGYHNVANGDKAMLSNTTGYHNVANGSLALSGNTTGYHNVANGSLAISGNTTGNSNTSDGYSSLKNNQTGSCNASFGAMAGLGSTGNSFSNNSLFGYKAGYALTTGSNNLLLGYQAGDNLTTGSNNIIFGYDINAPSATGNNQLVIGASDLFYGDLTNKRIGIGTTLPQGQLHINSNSDVLFILDADANDNGENDNPRLEMKQDGGNVAGAIGLIGNASAIYPNSSANAMYIMNEFDSPLQFGTLGNFHMTLLGNGYLGIGTTSPLGTLSIQKTIANLPTTLGDKGLVIQNGAGNYRPDIEIQDESGNAYFTINRSSIEYKSAGDANLILEADSDNQGGENDNPRIELKQDEGAVNGALGFIGETNSIYTNSIANSMYLMNEYGSAMQFGTTGSIKMTLSSIGCLGIGTTTPATKLDVKGSAIIRGNVTIRDNVTDNIVIELGTGLDYAEGFNVSDKSEVEPGTVMCIDPDHKGLLKVSYIPYDSKVAGIVAGANELGSGIVLGTGTHDCNVALAGRVYCNVDATYECVKAGDLLTTSITPGFAMKVTDLDSARGAVLGKAMESLEKGTKGKILVLVTLQ